MFQPTALDGALMAGGVAVLLLATGAAGAEERYPVRSTDDASASFANRISVVGNVLTPLGARLERISADWFQQQPGPPTAGSPFELAAHAVLAEANGVAIDAATFRSGEDIGIPPEADATIADGDTFAADGSTTGLTNQAAAVATVLREADDRLKAISADWFQIQPGPPTLPSSRRWPASTTPRRASRSGRRRSWSRTMSRRARTTRAASRSRDGLVADRRPLAGPLMAVARYP